MTIETLVFYDNEMTNFIHSALQFFTSGGGSKAWKGDISWWDPAENKFYYDGQGFMSMQISSSEVDVVFYDVYGNVLHKWSTSDVLYNVM